MMPVSNTGVGMFTIRGCILKVDVFPVHQIRKQRKFTPSCVRIVELLVKSKYMKFNE